MVKFQPSKLAMRVRFPLPAHLPMKIRVRSEPLAKSQINKSDIIHEERPVPGCKWPPRTAVLPRRAGSTRAVGPLPGRFNGLVSAEFFTGSPASSGCGLRERVEERKPWPQTKSEARTSR
jgi:hypothetical protein